MTDIFLFSGEANPQDIKLRDPTTSGGVTVITGTLAATDGADTAAFAGALAHVGTLAATDGADTAAFSGALVHVGTLAVTDGADTVAFSGQVGHAGTLAATDGQDTCIAIGVVVSQTQPVYGGKWATGRNRINDEDEEIMKLIQEMAPAVFSAMRFNQAPRRST